MLERLVDGGDSPGVLMPGTGMCAVPDSVPLTEHAVNLGCAGVLHTAALFLQGRPGRRHLCRDCRNH